MFRRGVLLVFLLTGLHPCAGETPAAAAPAYAEARLLFEKHWKERFPVPYLALYDEKPGHRVLVTRIQGVPVYYYRFQVDLPRLFRADDGSVVSEEEPARRVEVWFRYQPQLKQADFAFAREDLLPGTDRHWLE